MAKDDLLNAAEMIYEAILQQPEPPLADSTARALSSLIYRVLLGKTIRKPSLRQQLDDLVNEVWERILRRMQRKDSLLIWNDRMHVYASICVTCRGVLEQIRPGVSSTLLEHVAASDCTESQMEAIVHLREVEKVLAPKYAPKHPTDPDWIEIYFQYHSGWKLRELQLMHSVPRTTIHDKIREIDQILNKHFGCGNGRSST